MGKLIADKDECKAKGTLRGLLCNNIRHICRINIRKPMYTKQCRGKDSLMKVLQISKHVFQNENTQNSESEYANSESEYTKNKDIEELPNTIYIKIYR